MEEVREGKSPSQPHGEVDTIASSSYPRSGDIKVTGYKGPDLHTNSDFRQTSKQYILECMLGLRIRYLRH